MNKFYLPIAMGIAISIVFLYSNLSYAACNQNGTAPGGGPRIVCDQSNPNPDTTAVDTDGLPGSEVIVQDGAGIDVNSGQALTTGDNDDLVNIFGDLNDPDDVVRTPNNRAIGVNDGDDEVNIFGGLVESGTNRAVDLQGGNDRLHVENARLLSFTNDAITGSTGEDIVTVINSILDGADGTDLGQDDDEMTVVGSLINTTSPSSGDPGIDGGSGNDRITVENTIINSEGINAISGNEGDDIITIRSGVELNRRINCDRSNEDENEFFDQLVFNIIVPADQVQPLTQELFSKNPNGDYITINGLFYEWVNCTELVAEFMPPPPSNVPTLSQWGLIAMAGLLGIVGFIVMRRRQAVV